MRPIGPQQSIPNPRLCHGKFARGGTGRKWYLTSYEPIYITEYIQFWSTQLWSLSPAPLAVILCNFRARGYFDNRWCMKSSFCLLSLWKWSNVRAKIYNNVITVAWDCVEASVISLECSQLATNLSSDNTKPRWSGLQLRCSPFCKYSWAKTVIVIP